MNETGRPLLGIAPETGLSDLVARQLPAMVWSTDPELRVTAMTGVAPEALGIHPERVVGRTLADLYGTSDEGSTVLSGHLDALAGRTSAYEQNVGDARLECRVRPLRDEDGSIVGTIGIAIDVRERRWHDSSLENEQKYQGLIEAIPAVVYVDPLSDWQDSVYVSPQVVELLGCTQEEWLLDSSFWRRHVHPDDVERAWNAWKQARTTGEAYSIEYRMLHADGRVVWVCERAVFLRNEAGEPWLVQGVIFDITERKRVEAELEAAWQRERQAAEHLRKLDELRNLQLHAVSHDLRGPITAILGSALILERELQGLEDHHPELIEGILVSANKLHRLVTDLLDLDRLERGIVEPDRRPTDLAALARRVVEELAVGERKVHVEVEGVGANVDPVQVERIIENLLLNAMKYTPRGTPIWIRAGGEDGGVTISVEDSGPGVPEELRSVIFEPFRQGTEGQGLGIGLSLVARYAELHGGRAWVEDRAGGGAAFRVFLADPGSGEPDPHTGRVTPHAAGR